MPPHPCPASGAWPTWRSEWAPLASVPKGSDPRRPLAMQNRGVACWKTQGSCASFPEPRYSDPLHLHLRWPDTSLPPLTTSVFLPNAPFPVLRSLPLPHLVVPDACSPHSFGSPCSRPCPAGAAAEPMVARGTFPVPVRAPSLSLGFYPREDLPP